MSKFIQPVVKNQGFEPMGLASESGLLNIKPPGAKLGVGGVCACVCVGGRHTMIAILLCIFDGKKEYVRC